MDAAKDYDWPSLNHGVCPGCGERKFIGHGPLCAECVLAATRPTQRPASNSDARKRQAEAHQIHHDPAVNELIARERRAAAIEAWMEGAFFYGGDAAEQWYFNDGGQNYNPYRADRIAAGDDDV